MNNLNYKLMRRNKLFIIIVLLTYFILPFFDTKGIGLVSTSGRFAFRILSHQIFLSFLVVFNVLMMINEKFLRIQKSYLVIYTDDVKKNIICITRSLIVVNIISYNIGQIIFNVINFGFTKQVFGGYFKFYLLANVEIITIILFLVSLCVYFKKNLFVYTIYYSVIIALLVFNNKYFTIPMTVKFVKTLEVIKIDIIISRILILMISNITWLVTIKRYEKNFCEN